jgi:hypothetical protein
VGEPLLYEKRFSTACCGAIQESWRGGEAQILKQINLKMTSILK